MGAYTIPLSYAFTGDYIKKSTTSCDFPAANVMITTALTFVLGWEDEHQAVVGIKYVRERRSNGTVVQHDMGHGVYGWQTSYHGSNIVGVTFACACMASQLRGVGTIMVW